MSSLITLYKRDNFIIKDQVYHLKGALVWNAKDQVDYKQNDKEVKLE